MIYLRVNMAFSCHKFWPNCFVYSNCYICCGPPSSGLSWRVMVLLGKRVSEPGKYIPSLWACFYLVRKYGKTVEIICEEIPME